MNTLVRIGRYLGVAGLAAAAQLAQAQEYPARSVKLVVPYPPGGIADTFSRSLAQQLAERLGQPLVAENKPGASAIIGAEAVAKSPADGYTLFLGSVSSLAINVGIFRKLPYDPVKDFAPVSLVGSVGFGNSIHLAAELFKTMAGIDIVDVPYKGSSQVLPDLLSGRVQVLFDGGTFLTQVKAGKVRLLAVDEDVDPRDLDSVSSTISYRMQPHRSVEIREILVSAGLDFSLTPPAARDAAKAMKGSAILIDATRQWSYPPTSLPKKEYMESAQSLWRELGLPELKLKQPWFGYNLGVWGAEDAEDAERALRGEHYETGKLRERQRLRLPETEKG